MASEFKAKFREGAIIAIDELDDKYMKKELDTELLMNDSYIGYTDIWEDTARLFIFSTSQGVADFIKAARQIGYRTTGRVSDIIHMKNSDLKRPHLNKIRSRYSYMRELYK